MTLDEIRKAIAELPQNKSTEAERQIRELYFQIRRSDIEDAGEKEQLFDRLKAVACLELQKDLKKMIERKGLRQEALLILR